MYKARLQTILLIDDNPNDRLIVKRELNREFEDIAIQEIIDQKQFDLALGKADFDFVITDFQLGWSNGLKTLSAIKERLPECPVIMFTNTGTQEIAVEAMKSGLDDYVIKAPQHFVRLRQAVRSAWRKFQTQRKATELEQQLQSLLNQLDIGIFTANQSGQLLEANAATLNMLGIESIEAAQLALGQGLAAADRPIRVPYTREIELTPLSESSRVERSLWLKIIATPSQVNDKVIINGLIEDISAKKQAEQALNQLNQTLELQVEQRTEQLAGINRELELFAYSVSHDLRTPIRQIRGFADLLGETLSQSSQFDIGQNEAGKRAGNYLEVILDLADRANIMIDALLEFSRTGRAEMVYEPVDMDKVVQQLVSQAADNMPERSVHWRISPLPTVICDRTLIVTVWQNLIDNALKFTQSRTDTHIRIGTTTGDLKMGDLEPSTQTLPEKIVFFIEDNGIGFDAKQSERMFGMFQKAHSDEVIEGTGIGLASVKRIVARHRGDVWAEGLVSEGATFYFSLPIASAARR
ncbi:hybrid sensor histidine kinase/response regulator [cf. Phormidesmis sp. LEGE 11477]|uniref:hybrid sensor histidine kinase/response regulator n=1 Tax=cf. Phormidesmis sp. LEGE 11477 TaxID=1828680 RepID=UPI001881C1FC|nr:hybrid sensor histidine kinase/response regulator [cf. Phormidesmis sp. LEGE 11477]MBE9061019.1 response regulator [cf. Phormidesmis sp. LEGE 11477]